MTSLRGQLLVAAPQLLDPNFRRTVVLVGEHGEQGAMGLVLNRPSEVTVTDAVPLLADLVGDDDERVHVGGPVQEDAVVVLAEFAEPERAASIVVGAVGFLPGHVDDPIELGELARARVFAGYAGWAPGQLEAELTERAWIVAPAIADDVFTDKPLALWRSALRRRGGTAAILSLLPDDPRVN